MRHTQPDAWQLLARLDEAAPARRSPGRVVVDLIAAALTFGLWPAVTLPGRLRASARQQQATLGELANWTRRYASAAEADELSSAAKAVGVGFVAMAAMYLLAAVALAGLVYGVSSAPSYEPIALFRWLSGLTYGVEVDAEAVQLAAFGFWAGGLFTLFTIALMVHVRQAHRVRCFLDAFNRMTALRESLPPVYLPPTLLGLSLPWLLTAAVFLALRQPWGVPLAMAGGVLGRLDRRAWPAVRRELAERVRAIVLHNPPASRQSPNSPRLARKVRCVKVGCGGVLSTEAQFCGRCGSAARSQAVDND